jgi:hypothetical protein
LGDRKCLAEERKSFVEHPDAMQFLRISGQQVFQHPQAITLTTEGMRIERLLTCDSSELFDRRPLMR